MTCAGVGRPSWATVRDYLKDDGLVGHGSAVVVHDLDVVPVRV